MNLTMFWRWTFYLVGLIIMALGISMTIKGKRLGIGPWDVLHVGLYERFGLTIGTWTIILGLLIVISTTLVLKEWPKIGTWINMALLGIFIDIFNWLLPNYETLTAQSVLFVLGVVVTSYGIGLYMAPNVGAGPRDSLMLIFVEKFGISIKKIRTIIEVVVAIIGWILGGPVGVGTVVVAVLLGQLVHYTLPQSRKLLMKVLGEKDIKVLL